MIGKTLSHYKVIEKIGQGGMGEVYRAEDTNLSREVAIKVLPEQFTQDPQRLARFEREAKLLASLNHPNIAAIYGFEEADNVRFLAMELVPGDTLQERVAKGPVPVEEALEVCRQIAEGVEAAHEKGVIHRDLKPANVKVTPEGKVKILDFGLAKAFEDEVPVTDISQSPTLTEEMTRAGVILGTAAYMSPEQAKGKPVDKRADVFAFGAVLYELLTGKRAFQGETLTETLAKILEGEPDWKVVPESVPSRIQELMEDCLEKAPDDRLRDIGSARIQIKRAVKEPAPGLPVTGVGVVQPLWKRVIPWSVAAVAAIVAVFTLWNLTGPTANSVARFSINPSVTLAATTNNDIAISPDGNKLIYVALSGNTYQLYLRSVNDLEIRPIPGTEGAFNPFFAPGGEVVAFFSGGKLKRVPVSGGAVITLGEVQSALPSGDWTASDTILVADGRSGLYRMSSSGGALEELALPDRDKGEMFRSVKLLPGGQAALLTIRGEEGIRVEVLSLESGQQKTLLEEGRQAHYLPTGHLLYEVASTGNLMVVAFDLATLEVTSSPSPVLEGVRNSPSNYVDFAVSENGALAYVPVQTDLAHSLVWVDRDGRETLVTQEKREYAASHISPDGKQAVFSIHEGGSAHSVWIYNFERDSFSRLTFEGTVAGGAVWSPDGKWVTYQSNPDGKRNLYRQRADRSGQPERLTTSPNTQMAMSWSPDGQILAFNEAGRPTWSIGILPMEEGEPQYILDSSATECCARFSPDGKWLAYVSDELGRDNVYVLPFSGPEGVKFLISGEEGGGEPVWAPDGTELFYRSGNKMMAVSIETKPEFVASRPTVLFEGPYRGLNSQPRGYQYYDISSDGQHFLMVKLGDDTSQINVVLNWFEELKRLVPTP